MQDRCRGGHDEKAPQARQDTVDMIFALTSFAMFAILGRDRSVNDVVALVKSACCSALESLLSGTPRSRKPSALPYLILNLL
jgi:hypothetical protein